MYLLQIIYLTFHLSQIGLFEVKKQIYSHALYICVVIFHLNLYCFCCLRASKFYYLIIFKNVFYTVDNFLQIGLVPDYHIYLHKTIVYFYTLNAMFVNCDIIILL